MAKIGLPKGLENGQKSVKNQGILKMMLNAGLKLRVCTKKLIFLFLNQNICCGYSKEPSQ